MIPQRRQPDLIRVLQTLIASLWKPRKYYVPRHVALIWCPIGALFFIIGQNPSLYIHFNFFYAGLLKTFISYYGSLITSLFPSGLLSLNPLLPHPM